jgi:hypothetical protein
MRSCIEAVLPVHQSIAGRILREMTRDGLRGPS